MDLVGDYKHSYEKYRKQIEEETTNPISIRIFKMYNQLLFSKIHNLQEYKVHLGSIDFETLALEIFSESEREVSLRGVDSDSLRYSCMDKAIGNMDYLPAMIDDNGVPRLKIIGMISSKSLTSREIEFLTDLFKGEVDSHNFSINITSLNYAHPQLRNENSLQYIYKACTNFARSKLSDSALEFDISPYKYSIYNKIVDKFRLSHI